MPGTDLVGVAVVGRAEGVDQAVDPWACVGDRGAGGSGDREGDSLRPAFGGDPLHLGGRLGKRLIPADALPSWVRITLRSRASQWVEQPVGGLDEFGRGAALGTECRSGRMRPVRLDRDQVAVVDHRLAAATRDTERAEGRNALTHASLHAMVRSAFTG